MRSSLGPIVIRIASSGRIVANRNVSPTTLNILAQIKPRSVESACRSLFCPRPAHPCLCRSQSSASPSSSQNRSRRHGYRSCTKHTPPCRRAAPPLPAGWRTPARTWLMLFVVRSMIKPGQARRALRLSRIQNNEHKVVSPRQHAFLLVRGPVRFASTEELIHSGNEARSGWRSRYAPGKDPIEGNCVTIHGLRVLAVLVNNVAAQVDSGK